MDTFSTAYQDEEKRKALDYNAKRMKQAQEEHTRELEERKAAQPFLRQRIRNREAYDSLPESEKKIFDEERRQARIAARKSEKAFDSFADMTERTSDSQMRARLRRGIGTEVANMPSTSSVRNAPRIGN